MVERLKTCLIYKWEYGRQSIITQMVELLHKYLRPIWIVEYE